VKDTVAPRGGDATVGCLCEADLPFPDHA
jgi:hypothetical protein